MNLIKLHKRKIVVSLLVILEIISLFLVYKTRPIEEVVLDDVKLKKEDVSNNGFALMLETENTDGTTSYVESNSSSWPTDMKFNSELSGCIDVNGNIIEGALSFDNTNNIMNVSVGETAYCYVYFDIVNSLAKYINDNPTADFNTTMEGGLYRYQGTNDIVTNNYVCFGTSNKDTCVNNEDTYMYRIIGIDENNQIKLIKKTSIGNLTWHSDYTTDTPWPESDLFAYLNGNDYLLNTTYIPVGWESKIATTTWKYGDETSVSKTAANLYATENGWITSVSAKIGLIYLHDYYYASQSGGINCYSSSNYSTCKSAWMHISNNGSSTYEWTMSRYGYHGGRYFAWYVFSDGYVDAGTLTGTTAVRPVFYLTSDVEIIGGTGTSSDPFIIKE